MKFRSPIALMVTLAFACCCAFGAHAATRAWLDRSQAASGQPVTLNIETDQIAATPDFSPLQNDFQILDRNSSRQWSMANGKTQSSVLFAVVLQPRHDGALPIPALRVGNETTQPLRVDVRAAAPSDANDPNAKAFIETEIDDANPYVQQSVGVTVRLYYAVPLQSGQLDLDAPQGASLQRIGEDAQMQRDVRGRRFNVVERHYLLIADHSGALTLPAPRFAGQGVSGFLDDFFGGGTQSLSATGAPKTLNVRAQPDAAPQPWLPLRDLRLRYLAAPQNARAGEAATLTIEATAIGATRSQLPELPAPSAVGAQVFAEPAQYQESFRNGVPQVIATRRYSLVPEGSGKLHVAGPRVRWWDVQGASAKVAALPDLDLDVVPGVGGFSNRQLPTPESAIADAPSALRGLAPPDFGGAWLWPAVAAAFALLWVVTLIALAWALRRASRGVAKNSPTQSGAVAVATHAAAERNSKDLRAALDTGSLDDVADTLRMMHAPPLPDLDALIARLDDAAQRDALEQLRRARWAGGDGSAARAALRDAFKHGPKWKPRASAPKSALPPLYPK